LLFLAGLYFIRRETLDATIVSALLIGAVNIGLILILGLLVFCRLGSPYLHSISGGSAFDPSILQLIFGVILLAYFGHMSVSNCAQTVLQRNPDSPSLLWGSVAAQLVVMLIYCLWVLVVNGAIEPQILAAQSGTALAPLAAAIGPAVHILGSLFVILGMGIGTLHSSIPLYNLVRERLPDRYTRTLILPQRRGCLRFRRDPLAVVRAGRDFQLALSYLGPGQPDEAGDRQPQFGIELLLEGRLQQLLVPIATHWEIAALFGSVPGLQQAGVRLVIDVLDFNPAFVRLRTHSPLHLVYDGEWTFSGLSLADVFALPDLHQGLIVWLIREETRGSEGKSLREVAAHTGLPEIEARAVLSTLARQGFIEEILFSSETRFFSRLVSRRGSQLPNKIWQALAGEDEASLIKVPQNRTMDIVRQVFAGKPGRFLLSVSPVAAVFLLTEWLLMKQRESFTEPLNFLGLIVISMLGGIFPVLLLIASRRKGEIIPGVYYRRLGNPCLLTGIYLTYLAGLFLHGFLIWEDPGQRMVAILASSLVVGLTVRLVLKGGFAQRVVIELREDQRIAGGAAFHVVNGGQAMIADIQLSYREKREIIKAAAGEIMAFEDLKKATFDLSLENAREIKIWVHRITPEGCSMGLPGSVTIQYGGDAKESEMKLSAGEAILPVRGPTCRLMIDL
jgi:hypothetical protein